MDSLPKITNRCRSLTLALAAIIVAACATVPPANIPPGGIPGAPEQPSRPPAPPTTSANPPAKINLQGFPLPYRQGYADGCASTSALEQKDAARFKSDGQYRTGWFDGNALCKKP
ncbi:MAG: hypothetical protein E6H68_01120 [Betaproteobacteria bacterium]|nr:MAG: hypothetical protein E6H68_01120 [Betaproteobacteria bacterium]